MVVLCNPQFEIERILESDHLKLLVTVIRLHKRHNNLMYAYNEGFK